MRILGIDPGYAIVGFGVLEAQRGQARLVRCGAINTPAGVPMPQRLVQIQEDLETLIHQFAPDVMAIEELFFNTNVTTGIGVAQARGVIRMTEMCIRDRKIQRKWNLAAKRKIHEKFRKPTISIFL